jgi:hypothetical protein
LDVQWSTAGENSSVTDWANVPDVGSCTWNLEAFLANRTRVRSPRQQLKLDDAEIQRMAGAVAALPNAHGVEPPPSATWRLEQLLDREPTGGGDVHAASDSAPLSGRLARIEALLKFKATRSTPDAQPAGNKAADAGDGLDGLLQLPALSSTSRQKLETLRQAKAARRAAAGAASSSAAAKPPAAARTTGEPHVPSTATTDEPPRAPPPPLREPESEPDFVVYPAVFTAAECDRLIEMGGALPEFVGVDKRGRDCYSRLSSVAICYT